MRQQPGIIVLIVVALGLTGCGTSSSSIRQPVREPATATAAAGVQAEVHPAPAAAAAPADTPGETPAAEHARPSALKPDDTEVPAEVRAIEKAIDRKAAILADEVRIEVSKNYEWDVSLSGDGVSPQRPENGGMVSESVGNPRAWFRNLDIRARQKIVFWRSGLNVTPFIRIVARGDVSYIDAGEQNGPPRLTRAGLCRIDNASVTFDGEALRPSLRNDLPLGDGSVRKPGH